LQPRAVRVAVIATAPPPIIAGRSLLSFRGNDGAGRGADHGARNCAAAAAERAADDTAKRATNNRAGERILRRSVLRRQQRRKSQEYSSPRHPHHVPSPFICIRTFGSRRSRNDDAMLIWNHKVFAGENVTRLPALRRRFEFLFRPPQRPFALPRTTIDSTTLDGRFP
jgi:hypothetical protein